MIYEYLGFLEGGLDPSTVVNHLWSLKKYLTFIQAFKLEAVAPGMTALIESIQKGLRKKREHPEVDVDTLIEERSWPRHGIKDLRKIIERYEQFFQLLNFVVELNLQLFDYAKMFKAVK